MKTIDGQLLCAVRVPREKVLAACEETEESILAKRAKSLEEAEALVPRLIAKHRKSLWCRLFCRRLSDGEFREWISENVRIFDCNLWYAYWSLKGDAESLHRNQLVAVRTIRESVLSTEDELIWLSNEAVSNLGGRLS